MTAQPKVSIVILDYLKSTRVVENVQSLQQQRVDFPIEIIVADNSCNAANAAKLRELERFPNVTLVINETNLGYTRGCNAGARRARGEYILILNPDIVFRHDDTLARLVAFLETHPSVGIVGPRQIDEPTGETTMTVRAWPRFFLQVARRTFLRRLPLIRDLVAYDEMRHLDYDRTQPVDWLQSSCMLIRRSLFEAVGGFDERYFLFMSDPEICWQAWSRGFEVIYYPEVVVYADGIRASSGGFRAFFQKWTLRQHVIDSLRYSFRHFGRHDPRRVYHAASPQSTHQ